MDVEVVADQDDLGCRRVDFVRQTAQESCAIHRRSGASMSTTPASGSVAKEDMAVPQRRYSSSTLCWPPRRSVRAMFRMQVRCSVRLIHPIISSGGGYHSPVRRCMILPEEMKKSVGRTISVACHCGERAPTPARAPTRSRRFSVSCGRDVCSSWSGRRLSTRSRGNDSRLTRYHSLPSFRTYLRCLARTLKEKR